MDKNTMSAATYPMFQYKFSKMDLRILMLLTERGSLNQYKISKGIDADYPTTHKAIKNLEAGGFVKFEREEVTEKGGRAKVYGLTLKGLISLITLGLIKKNVDKVASKWGHLLPLFLGKWDYFKEMGLEDEILKLLRIEGSVLRYFTRADKEIFSKENVELFSIFYFFNLILNPNLWESTEKWLRAFRGDEEVKAWVIKGFEYQAASLKESARVMEEVIDAVKAVEEPDWEGVKKKIMTWSDAIKPFLGRFT